MELKMAPIREQVGIPFPWTAFDEAAEPHDPRLNASAAAMLDELLWWARVLRPAPERVAVAAC